MKIMLTVKSISSRKNYLDQLEMDLAENISSLQELIEEIVRQNVQSYNHALEQNPLTDFLIPVEMAEWIAAGKVGFGKVYGERKAELEKAFREAEAAFKDGLYRVFLNDREVEDYKQEIKLQQGDNVVFLRLTMLTGRLW